MSPSRKAMINKGAIKKPGLGAGKKYRRCRVILRKQSVLDRTFKNYRLWISPRLIQAKNERFRLFSLTPFK